MQDWTQLPALLGLQHCAPVSVLRQQHWLSEHVSFPQFAMATTMPDNGVNSSKVYESGSNPEFTKLTP